MARLILDTTVLHVRGAGRQQGAHDLVVAATAKATHRAVVSDDAVAFSDLPGFDHRS